MERFKDRARKLRASQTSAEGRLWRALRNRRLACWKFRRQHPIDRYVVDFVTLDGRLIVEVDGVTHSSAGERRRDAERTHILESLGFQVVRGTDVDIFDNLEGVLEMIYRELHTDGSRTPSL
jgi:very-short-patch-repair endonuclease